MPPRPEKLMRYGCTLVVSGRLMDDGPALMRAIEELKDRFARGLERDHLVLASEVEYRQDDYDPRLDAVRMVVTALTVRDPAWVQSIWESARRAVEEDQAVLRELREQRVDT